MSRSAGALAAATLIAVAGDILVLVTAPRAIAPGEFGVPGYQAVFALAYVSVGYVIATRRPRLLIGPALLVAALAIAVGGFAHEWALRSAAGPPLPGADIATWLDAWTWGVNTAALALTIFRFPDGRRIGPNWTWPERIALTSVGLALLLTAFVPGPTLSSGLSNPFGLPWLSAIPASATNVPGVPGTMVAVAALAVRARRSRGLERLQLKWLVSAMAAVTTVAVAMVIARALSEAAGMALQIALVIVTPLIPLSIGVAILRHRLYDIDVLIRRTLVYGALSVALVATYVALVVVVQALLRPLTAGSELAVAGSTLVTLAVVQPLRHRIGAVVDRRFYRARYDAARTLDTFTAELRDEVDIDSVRAGLLGAVGETVRPAHASVWLRPERP